MTIKDIAEKAGVSVATVSFVLNDKCVEKKISKATQERVWETVRELGYQPNILARTLRSDLEESNKYYITIFWTTDKRDRIMIRFLRGLQEEVLRKELNCEITIKPYENNHLQEAMTDRTLKMCHGIILCNASEKDMEYINKIKLSKALVIYNRYSDFYCTVNVDDRELGEKAAQVFINNKCTNPLVIASKARFSGMNLRTSAFQDKIISYDLPKPQKISSKDTISGGYQVIHKYFDQGLKCDSVFCTSDSIALGVLRAFHERNIKVPEEIKVIAIGSAEDEQEEYAIPSLSVVKIPIEDMGKKCISLLYKILNFNQREIVRIKVPIEFKERESCPVGIKEL